MGEMKQCNTDLSFKTSQLLLKKLNRVVYPDEDPVSILNIKNISVSEKFPLPSNIVMFRSLLTLTSDSGQPARVFRRYVLSLCFLDEGKLMTLWRPNSHSFIVPHLNTGHMYWFDKL